MLLVLDQIYKHTTELTTGQKTWNSTIGKQDSSTALLEHIDYLSNLCRNMVLQTKYEQQRVQTLLAVVRSLQIAHKIHSSSLIQAHNHMAFSAANANNQIGADSKMISAAAREDSAAMKMRAQASLEDNDTMKRIALETKKDSSAMKTIALLTMLFLPGTFVAVCSLTYPLFISNLEVCSIYQNRLSSRCHYSTGMHRRVCRFSRIGSIYTRLLHCL